ncbi:MAG: hypothetical protein ACTSRA_12630, partial [Promethearchaeota archaeon]
FLNDNIKELTQHNNIKEGIAEFQSTQGNLHLQESKLGTIPEWVKSSDAPDAKLGNYLIRELRNEMCTDTQIKEIAKKISNIVNSMGIMIDRKEFIFTYLNEILAEFAGNIGKEIKTYKSEEFFAEFIASSLETFGHDKKMEKLKDIFLGTLKEEEINNLKGGLKEFQDFMTFSYLAFVLNSLKTQVSEYKEIDKNNYKIYKNAYVSLVKTLLYNDKYKCLETLLDENNMENTFWYVKRLGKKGEPDMELAALFKQGNGDVKTLLSIIIESKAFSLKSFTGLKEHQVTQFIRHVTEKVLFDEDTYTFEDTNTNEKKTIMTYFLSFINLGYTAPPGSSSGNIFSLEHLGKFLGVKEGQERSGPSVPFGPHLLLNKLCNSKFSAWKTLQLNTIIDENGKERICGTLGISSSNYEVFFKEGDTLLNKPTTLIQSISAGAMYLNKGETFVNSKGECVNKEIFIGVIPYDSLSIKWIQPSIMLESEPGYSAEKVETDGRFEITFKCYKVNLEDQEKQIQDLLGGTVEEQRKTVDKIEINVDNYIEITVILRTIINKPMNPKIKYTGKDRNHDSKIYMDTAKSLVGDFSKRFKGKPAKQLIVSLADLIQMSEEDFFKKIAKLKEFNQIRERFGI